MNNSSSTNFVFIAQLSVNQIVSPIAQFFVITCPQTSPALFPQCSAYQQSTTSSKNQQSLASSLWQKIFPQLNCSIVDCFATVASGVLLLGFSIDRAEVIYVNGWKLIKLF
ncbi:hypothetical protein ACOSQ4_012462 [Xanthoceras sorbifolium]